MDVHTVLSFHMKGDGGNGLLEGDLNISRTVGQLAECSSGLGSETQSGTCHLETIDVYFLHISDGLARF